MRWLDSHLPLAYSGPHPALERSIPIARINQSITVARDPHAGLTREFRVTKAMNLLDPLVGSTLSEKDVQKLIDAGRVTVKVVAATR